MTTRPMTDEQLEDAIGNFRQQTQTLADAYTAALMTIQRIANDNERDNARRALFAEFGNAPTFAKQLAVCEKWSATHGN